MDRRTLLRRVGAIGAATVAGCVGESGQDGLAVEGTAPTVRLGETVAVVARVANATRVQFSMPAGDQLDASGADVSPSPDMQMDSFPPIWTWETPQSAIEATLTVETTADATPSEYTYGVRAANEEKRMEAEFVITIAGAG